jgi:hypothetical protein
MAVLYYIIWPDRAAQQGEYQQFRKIWVEVLQQSSRDNPVAMEAGDIGRRTTGEEDQVM